MEVLVRVGVEEGRRLGEGGRRRERRRGERVGVGSRVRRGRVQLARGVAAHQAAQAVLSRPALQDAAAARALLALVVRKGVVGEVGRATGAGGGVGGRRGRRAVRDGVVNAVLQPAGAGDS